MKEEKYNNLLRQCVLLIKMSFLRRQESTSWLVLTM